MVNTCAVVNRKTCYKTSENRIDIIPVQYLLFGFPENNPDIFKQWVVFVNRKSWPNKIWLFVLNIFKKKYLKIGKSNRNVGFKSRYNYLVLKK